MIRLSDDIRRNAIPTSTPPSGDLNRNSTTKFESLGDKDAGTFLELDKPLASFTSPETALVIMFVFEFLRFSFSDLDGLQIVNEFDFLDDDLFVRIVAAEQLRFYGEPGLV
jgi:hypothetical protein